MGGVFWGGVFFFKIWFSLPPQNTFFFKPKFRPRKIEFFLYFGQEPNKRVNGLYKKKKAREKKIFFVLIVGPGGGGEKIK